MHRISVRVNFRGFKKKKKSDFKVKLSIDQRKPVVTEVGYSEEEEE